MSMFLLGVRRLVGGDKVKTRRPYARKRKKCLEGCVFVHDGVPDCVADGVCPLCVLGDGKNG